MERKSIDIGEFRYNNLGLFNEWLLLTAGDFKRNEFNSMTISWGSVGVMWGHPMVQVVVRPTRHTYNYIQKDDTFTVCAFPAQYRNALSILGSKSGRDCNKIAEAEITPVASQVVGAPCFKEAQLVIECKKMYWHDFDPSHFIADFIAPLYSNDYHRSYFGEIMAIYGTDTYVRN